MSEAEIPAGKPADNSDEARRKAAEYQQQETTGAPAAEAVDTERSPASLNEDIRARVRHPHKGDVGRPGTNEEIFQGSKQKELNS